MKTNLKKLISTLLTLAVVFSLFAAYPAPAYAADTAIINVSYLGDYDVNNKQNSKEAQWEYKNGIFLNLKTNYSSYILTGTSNRYIIIDVTSLGNPLIYFENLNMPRAMLRIYGNNQSTKVVSNGTNTFASISAGGDNHSLSISGNGTLNMPGDAGHQHNEIDVSGKNAILSIGGNSFTVNLDSALEGIAAPSKMNINGNVKLNINTDKNGITLGTVSIIDIENSAEVNINAGLSGIALGAGSHIVMRDNTNVIINSAKYGIDATYSNIIEVGAAARLDVSGDRAGINSNDLTLFGGSITATGTGSGLEVNSIGISNTGRLNLRGLGSASSIVSTGASYGIYSSSSLYIENCSVTAKQTGNIGDAVYKTNNINMDDNAKLTVTQEWADNNPIQYTVNRTYPSSTYRWRLDGDFTTESSYTAGTFKAYLPNFSTGTISREPNTVLKFVTNPAYNIPASTAGIPIPNINVSSGVSGGSTPYTFSATGLPVGISINSATGVISGTPTAWTGSGTATITVTDRTSATASITISRGEVNGLKYTHTPYRDIPNATVGNTIGGAPTDTINTIYVGNGVSGGTPPYTFSATGLPYGLEINPGGGQIIGKFLQPSPKGTASITVKDSLNMTLTFQINVGTVALDTNPLTVAPPQQDGYHFIIPYSIVGVPIEPIDISSVVSGGTPPYEFESNFDESYSLWQYSGIGIDRERGILSGAPSEACNEGEATIYVYDYVWSTPVEISIFYNEVEPPDPFSANDVSIPASWVGIPIEPIDASAGVYGGVPPYYFFEDPSHKLPDGLVIDSVTGIISGAPTTVETAWDANIHIMDRTSQDLMIYAHYGAVQPVLPLAFTFYASYNIPASRVGVDIEDLNITPAYNGVSGGFAPYKFSATGLPDGIDIHPSGGYLMGTFTAEVPAGTATITVTDTYITPTEKSITISYGAIASAIPPLAFPEDAAYEIPPTPEGTPIASIDLAPDVTGGIPPYTFAAAGLPDGITISAAGVISGTLQQEVEEGAALIIVVDSANNMAMTSIEYGAITEVGVTVSGSVRTYNPNNPMAIQLLQGAVDGKGGSVVGTVIIPAESGSGERVQSYSFTDVAPGTYTLKIIKPRHLSYTKVTLVVGSSDVIFKEVTLVAGDLNNDGAIEAADFLLFRNDYGKSGSAIPGDLNGDGTVDAADFLIFRNGYGKSNAVES